MSLACASVKEDSGVKVDLKKDLPLLDEGAFLKILLGEVPLDLGVDLGVHQAVGGAHPLPHDGHVLDDHLHDFHRGRNRPGRLLLTAAHVLISGIVILIRPCLGPALGCSDRKRFSVPRENRHPLCLSGW